jgi:hypothetical protein
MQNNINWTPCKTGAYPTVSTISKTKAYLNHSDDVLIWFDEGSKSDRTGVYFGFWHCVLEEWFVKGLSPVYQSKITHYAYINAPTNF